MSAENNKTPRSTREVIKNRLKELIYVGDGGFLLIKVTLKDVESQNEYSRGIIYNYEDGNSDFINHVYTKFKCDRSDYVIKSNGDSKQELVIEDEEDFFAPVIKTVDKGCYYEEYEGREIEFFLVPLEV